MEVGDLVKVKSRSHAKGESLGVITKVESGARDTYCVVVLTDGSMGWWHYKLIVEVANKNPKP